MEHTSDGGDTTCCVLIDQLTSAILGSRVARVASLLRRGVPVNGADKNGTTPLYKAAVQGETEIVRVLLEAGADPNLESGGQDEGTPLCAAASWGRTEVVRLLLQHGADPNAVETKQRGPMTALAWAQHGGYAEGVDLLVEAGAHPSKYERSGGVHGKAWDLRVACFLVSLDIVEPFLAELGFRTDYICAVRQAARAYLADWPIDNAETWLAPADQTYGKPSLDAVDKSPAKLPPHHS